MTMTVRRCMLSMAIMCGLPGIMLAVTDPIWFGLAVCLIGMASVTLYVLGKED